MRILLCALAAPLLLGAADPQWVRVASGSDGSVWLAGANSVRANGETITVWVKVVTPPSQAYALWNIGYDCSTWSSQTLSITKYRANGTVLDRDVMPSVAGSSIGYQPMSPGSIDEGIANWACNRR